VLLLDEPSSGLDAFSAFSLVRLLKVMAKRTNRTVLVSVHQPSSQLFELFDGLLLLVKGRRAYNGRPLDAVAHLKSLGAPSPEPGVAPADHLLHVLVTHAEMLSERIIDAHEIAPPDKRVRTLSEGNSAEETQHMLAPDSAVSAEHGQRRARCSCVSDVFTEAKWLGWRCVAQLAREPSLIRTQLAVHLLVALFMGGVFFEVQSDIAGFQNKAGSLSFMLSFFAFGGLSTSQSVTREWPLLWAEYHQGLYGAVTYTVTRLLLELTLLRVLPAIAFSAIFYPMMGLKRELAAFTRFLFAAALASADSALLCAAISACAPRKPGATALVATVALLICLLVNGFNLNLNALPGWIEWLAWLSFARHAFEIMLCGELEDTMVDFQVPNAPSVRIQANVILTTLGLESSRYSSAFGALIAIGVVLIVLTATIVAMQVKPLFRRAATVVGATQLRRPEITLIRRVPSSLSKNNAMSSQLIRETKVEPPTVVPAMPELERQSSIAEVSEATLTAVEEASVTRLSDFERVDSLHRTNSDASPEMPPIRKLSSASSPKLHGHAEI